MKQVSRPPLLQRLAHGYGVQTSYYDVSHRRQTASTEAMLAVLRSLGAPLLTANDIPSAWREYRQAKWQQPLEPVVVSWDGQPPAMAVRLLSTAADASLVGSLTLENGEQHHWEWHAADLPIIERAKVEGADYLLRRLLLPCRLPVGYHRFTLEIAGAIAETLIIAAPLKAYPFPDEIGNRTWGVFLPLYALHSRQSWGGGDFSSLNALIDWVAGLGGGVVASLPLLSIFLNETFEPSPYLPVSRLFWNEFYLDTTDVPEWQQCASAQAMLSSPSAQREIACLRDAPLVDYRRQMALKRSVLEELCQHLFSQPSERLEALHLFARNNPQAEDYARFRAVGEKQGTPWQSWQQRLREGTLREGDYDEQTKRYHLYVQWLAHQQMASVSAKARAKGIRLYLDLPLGVHPCGYDVWREQSIFAPDVSAGSPPDIVYTRGQDWTFPPLHPQRIRTQGYRYVIAYLRHHLQHAGILRIDHVMSLHRLFWIPHGCQASEGVYVRYRAEELYAILALESQRYHSLIVGEDLGTVPAYVRPALAQHGLHRMYTVQYELAPVPRAALPPVPADSVANLNTHDMPPFAAFWQGQDIAQRLELGLLDKAGARPERKSRREIRKALSGFLKHQGWPIESEIDERSVFMACMAYLSASPARVVLANLEDLWAEIESQNVPSTREEHPNWQRKARYSLEALCQMPEVRDTLREIDSIRKTGLTAAADKQETGRRK